MERIKFGVTTGEWHLIDLMLLDPTELIVRGKKQENGQFHQSYSLPEDMTVRNNFLRLKKWVEKHPKDLKIDLPIVGIEALLAIVKHYKDIASVVPFVSDYITLVYKLENKGKEIDVGSFDE
jgi:hypothetical protein